MSRPALSRLQRDILELESRTWRLDGSKMTEFRRRHPRVTETGYYVALSRLLENPDAYEYDNRRYAATLKRISDRYEPQQLRRLAFRGALDLEQETA